MTVESSTPETAEQVRALVAEFIGATLHGALYVGRTPDGFDGATKDDVIELAGQLAELLNAGFTVVSGGEGLQHGAALEQVGMVYPDGTHPHARKADGRCDFYPCEPVYRASGAAPGTTAEPAQQPCSCGHRSLRHGPCLVDGCSCDSFRLGWPKAMFPAEIAAGVSETPR